MRYLKTSEAASLLRVSPNTLRTWERRFGFPKPQRSPGKHRLYTHGEIAALRDALLEGLSISSAISRAREGMSTDAASLFGSLASYDRDRADLAMEGALALRSVERSVEEVLLPTVDEIRTRHGAESAAWAFAAHWASDWLARAMRLAPAPTRPASIVLGDGTRDELDGDAAHLRALELFCRRGGVDVLNLSIRGVAGIGEALAAHPPSLVVIAGSHLSDDAVARWAYAVRTSAGPVPVAVYRRESIRMSARADERVLPVGAASARRRIMDMLARGERQAAGERLVVPVPRGGEAAESALSLQRRAGA
ncbi:MAG: MerR family DNA-binding transcriptional regulator [Solirubrobacteraceae bacterium]